MVGGIARWVADKALFVVTSVVVHGPNAMAALNEAWWMVLIVDEVISRMSGGKFRFPRSLADATQMAAEWAWADFKAAASNDALRRTIAHVLLDAVGKHVLSAAHDEILKRIHDEGGAVAAFSQDVRTPIPSTESLSAWIRRMQSATGLSRDTIINMRGD